jgi:DNA-binding MarR family transcriptional regulator
MNMADADEEVVEAILHASRALLGVVARSIAPALDHVTLPQFRVLVVLATTGPLRMGALAERMGAQPSTFSRTVDRMVANGWLSRAVNEGSRREILVQATAEGRQLVDGVTDRRREELRRILVALTGPERRQIEVALSAFSSAAGEPHPAALLPLGL